MRMVLSVCGWILLTWGAPAQVLPPTAPTAPPGGQVASPTSVQQAPNGRAQGPARRAKVAYSGKILQVTADDASLNQILREIGRVTGMKITGGVTEERVFGIYGPADTSAVLTALLGGTGSNMLLSVDTQNKPLLLVLTPRQGGPTPPSPNAAGRSTGDDEDPDTPPQLSRHVRREPVQPITVVEQPVQPGPPPVEGQSSVPVTADPVAPAAPAAGTTTQQSPNGVKTPQEIYDQLMKLQQQKKPQ